MKIFVKDHKQIKIRVVVPVNIKYLSGDLEKVTVRLFGNLVNKKQRQAGHNSGDIRRRPPNSLQKHRAQRGAEHRKLVWHHIFNKMLVDTFMDGSDQRLKQTKTRPIEIKFTLPSLPKISSLSDLKKTSNQARRGLARNPKKSLTALGTIALLLGIIFYFWFSHSSSTKPPQPIATHSNSSSAPKLTKGTPNYTTILPAGKTIKALGGWTRISPVSKNAVYAYVDKIGSVQVDVSEQPLPANFQTDTNKRVAELAQNFNATEKIPAGTTNIYIATLADNSQSVIFTKDKLLVFMKSV